MLKLACVISDLSVTHRVCHFSMEGKLDNSFQAFAIIKTPTKERFYGRKPYLFYIHSPSLYKQIISRLLNTRFRAKPQQKHLKSLGYGGNNKQPFWRECMQLYSDWFIQYSHQPARCMAPFRSNKLLCMLRERSHLSPHSLCEFFSV